MKVLIIEDEFRNYNRLRKMLQAYDPTMTIEGPLESVEETRQWLSVHKGENAPDLVLADIRLSDGISFDALDGLDASSSLVFTTAYDEYALQAFQYNGLAYLMKPIEEEELHQTLDRIKLIRGKANNSSPSTFLSTSPSAFPSVTSSSSAYLESVDLKNLLAQMRADNYQYRERFLVPYKDGYEVVNVEDVAFICTEFKDTRIYLMGEKKKFYSISMSLDEIERQLNPHRFFRVNRQFIINVSVVKGLKTYFGGKLRVCILGYEEEEVMCSRDKASQLKEWLNQ